jgi:hypothetical protein
MKDVIDVMQLQREKSRQVPAIDYTETENNFITVRFIFECGKCSNCYEIYEVGRACTTQNGNEICIQNFSLKI